MSILNFIAAGDGLYQVKPAGGDTPGQAFAEKMANAVMYYGVIFTVVGLVLSAGLWAVGAFSNNYTQSVNGKKGFLICAAAALVIGGANVLVGYFYNQGATSGG